MQIHVNNCPACGCGDHTPVYPNLNIVRCEGCSLAYLTLHNDRHTTWQFYQEYATKPGSHMVPPANLEQAKQSRLRRTEFMDMVTQFVSPGSLMDVGGGWGGLVMEAKERGYSPTLLELCEGSCQWCREHLQVPALSQWLDLVGLPSFSLDVVVGVHSFEHLDKLAEGLMTVKRLLRPGGMIAGIVPNFESATSRTVGTRWHWLDAECHYQHFTPHSLVRVLRRFGFVPVHIETRNGDYRTDLISVATGLEHPEVLTGVGLGEEIWFVFRKCDV